MANKTYTALITPFKSDLSVDFDAIKKIVTHQATNGIDGLVLFGTTGESVTLNKTEKQQITDFIVGLNTGLELIIGIGGNHTAGVIETFEQTDLSPFTQILSVCPYYNKPNQDGIIAHYKAIADISPLPIILYNVPGRTGVNMTAKTQLVLAEHPNICATKEASGNMEQIMNVIKNAPEGFNVFSGDDSLTFPMLALGANGVISVVSHAIPEDFSNMVKLAKVDILKSRELHYKHLNTCIDIFADGSPGGIKIMLNEMKMCDTFVRPPLHQVSSEIEKHLRNLVK